MPEGGMYRPYLRLPETGLYNDIANYALLGKGERASPGFPYLSAPGFEFLDRDAACIGCGGFDPDAGGWVSSKLRETHGCRMTKYLVARQIQIGLSGDHCHLAPSIGAAEKQTPNPLLGEFVRRGDQLAPGVAKFPDKGTVDFTSYRELRRKRNFQIFFEKRIHVASRQMKCRPLTLPSKVVWLPGSRNAEKVG